MTRYMLKIVIISIAIFSIIFCVIISQNQVHLDNCEDDNCPICAIIHLAQAIIQMTFGICVFTVSFFLIHYVLAKIKKFDFFIIQISLISQKVRYNE